ncbi:hypothetical protein LTR49_028256 [Elasticomyces elasticus]|nr:hypothetical protein LTR49_028256 [Elasticomyces elasticus]
MFTSRELYVTALGAVQTALLDVKAIREDAALVASMLLAIFKRYNWQTMMTSSEWMMIHAEETWGPKHTSTLDTVNNLAILYKSQGKMQEAEEMYLRALREYKEAWGPKHASTLDTVKNLGDLYSNQGQVKEAEEMFVRALEGCQTVEGDREADIEYLQEQLKILRAGRQASIQHLQSDSRNLKADISSDVVDQNDRTARMRDLVLRVLMQP